MAPFNWFRKWQIESVSFRMVQKVMENGSYHLMAESGPIQGETDSG